MLLMVCYNLLREFVENDVFSHIIIVFLRNIRIIPVCAGERVIVMAKLRFGIVGVGRGSCFLDSLKASGAEVVAYCDKDAAGIERVRQYHEDDMKTYHRLF